MRIIKFKTKGKQQAKVPFYDRNMKRYKKKVDGLELDIHPLLLLFREMSVRIKSEMKFFVVNHT